ncbi:MAG TPA: sulfotransferase [Povalibacter sp.]|uniref:tetratricopeptide repeat-containing sulfotransferase family protein n=1 Tax=Povalibacter sp. TaxID=1962978 RepID=UPI002CBAC37E|nr:sulfotransferase [Povalibacter sp.]HMN43986.1 sulfotransferase [Povalibacter sp.]
MTAAVEPAGTLDTALAHTAHLLHRDPALAVEQASEILKVVPGHPQAILLLGIGQRLRGDVPAALAVLTDLAAHQPNSAQTHYELGLTLAADGQGDAAVAALRRALQLKPDLPDAWRVLGDHLRALDDPSAADEAYAQHIRHSTRNPRLLEAAAALCENRIAEAEALLRDYLKQTPTDVPAIRMLAEVAARLGRYADAESLLERCLELAPGFVAARHNHAVVLHRQNKSPQALMAIDQALAADPRNHGYRSLKAAILSTLGDYDAAIELYSQVVDAYPRHAKVWMSFAHTLKTAGRQQESIAGYRRSIELAPHLGEAYWSLANLKTFRFSAAERAAMQALLDRDDLSAEDRFHLHFALGKACEDMGDHASSFRHYDTGNRQRRALIQYRADDTSEYVRRCQSVFTADFFNERRGWGAREADPVFIVGLPRAGSTLLEQILASHPLVEGTMELTDIVSLARELADSRWKGADSRYPEVLASLTAEQCEQLGRRYLDRTRIYRKQGLPFFIDKMPNNFAHVGLIHLILPNARIIDARRHPLGCCFSAFKQHFARGQHFTYGLEDLGRYYHDYVELMAHIDGVLPGRIHRVIYEEMVDDTELQVRRLLEYCGLPFDERCLRFYENDRAVRTASSEQVRQPIFKDGVDHWRHFDAWLEPLRQALGPMLDSYPAVPPFEPH